MKKYFCIVFLFLTAICFAIAQSPDDRYKSGKDFIKKGKYGPAMEVLKPLLSEAPNNPYVKHAYYLYALSAMNAGKTDDASQIIRQLILKYTAWEYKDEAKYLNANILFEQGKYKDAIDVLNGLPKSFDKDADYMKANYLAKTDNMESLKWLQTSFPEDKQIAQVLANKLSVKCENEKDKILLKYLQQEFKLEPAKQAAKATQKKQQYNVAVLFPFMLNKLQVENVSRPNQFILDMYQGIKLAVDSLNKTGAKINLYAYDTEKDLDKFQELLANPELKEVDLIIGPVYNAHIPVVTSFAEKNGIQFVVPFSNDPTDANSSLAYLIQPSYDNQTKELLNVVYRTYKPGLKSGEDERRKNNSNAILIIYGKDDKDSLLAYSYKKIVEERTKNSPKSDTVLVIKSFQKITRENVNKIKATLTDSSAMRKVNHIAVFTGDQVVAANIISATEILGFDVPLFTTSDWLDFNLITVDQFERRNVHFLNPGYLDYSKNATLNFEKSYLDNTHMFPTTSSYHGYDYTFLFGKMLQQNGTYFGDVINSKQYISGPLLGGYNFSAGKSNSYVPVVKFANGMLININKAE